jgi:hypothetical protein
MLDQRIRAVNSTCPVHPVLYLALASSAAKASRTICASLLPEAAFALLRALCMLTGIENCLETSGSSSLIGGRAIPITDRILALEHYLVKGLTKALMRGIINPWTRSRVS